MTGTKVCKGCGQPLGEARLVVHTAEGKLDGEYHAPCFGARLAEEEVVG